MKIFTKLLSLVASLSLNHSISLAAIPKTLSAESALTATATSTTNTNQKMVRVHLTTVGRKIQITGLSLRFQNREQTYRSVSIAQNGKAEVRLLEKDGKNFWSLKLNDQDREHLFTEKYLMIQGQDLRAGARALPEKVMLVANKKNVDLIGVLPLEEYVAGVLASEVPLSWPMETLKAQAVAIRSYTMAVMQERQSRDFHVESTVMDQVFNHDPALSTSKNHKAVEATRATEGVVLYGPDQKVLKAFYHADCGGHTTAAKNVWKGGVDSGVAVDSSCPTRPRSHWSFKISREALIKRLHIASISSLTLLRAHGESRVEAVQVAMNDGAHKVIEANQFRQMLGFKDLRSTLFDMKEEARHIVFVGRGFGHGVGLCQWGSRALGLAGEKFQDILKHYYPLARLD